MKLNFCTLFDSCYLTRGLALYNSLLKKCPDFHLFIFPFDDIAFKILEKMNLECVTLIKQKDFENGELLELKKTRNTAEYFWTCTPVTIDYCIKKFNLDHCIYIDADLYFFGNPAILINEIPVGKTVLITEHRYTKEYDQSEIHGRYCVQFMYFKNEMQSLRVLEKWEKQCLSWCFDKKEDGKFGDQKYLDNWEKEYNCVHVLENLGGGVAPWNVQQYDFRKRREIVGNVKSNHVKFNLIFFHFHGYKIFKDNIFYLNHGYEISKNVRDIIYYKYAVELMGIYKNKFVENSHLLNETILKSPVFLPSDFIDKLRIYKNELQNLFKHKNIGIFKENISNRITPKNYVKYKKRWLFPAAR